tara:strand:- start:25392 stop:26600 length:1209 start_codon:yes stop_codon:yes gene_type:complete
LEQLVEDNYFVNTMRSTIKKFIKKFNLLIHVELSILKPKKCQVLIYEESEFIEALFEKEFTAVLKIYSKHVNLFVLISSIINKRNYYDEYVNVVSPNILITFFDNDLNFIHIVCKKTIKITVQNGMRSHLGDIFSNFTPVDPKNANLYVDYMCVFGKNIATELSKYIAGQTILIGSLRNNKSFIRSQSKKNEILFISTFRPEFYKPDSLFYPTHYPLIIRWRDYIKNTLTLISWLKEYCDKSGFLLNILGARDGVGEHEYYKTLLKSEKFVFYERVNKNRGAYHIVDQFETIVNVDSTLGYEALARGCKVAMFGGIIGKNYPLNTRRFGWPGNYAQKGPFWTDSLEHDQWEKILNYVINTDTNAWQSECYQYVHENMIYDEGNKNLISLLRSLNAPLSKGIL